MGTRKVELGEAGHTVAAQVRRIRERKGLSLQALSQRLKALGRPVLPSGLSKIEQGHRRVDVDDLVALASALETSPNVLLMAPEPSADIEQKYEEAVDALLTIRSVFTDSAGLTESALGITAVITADGEVTDGIDR
jgi:transcriptional regulator with XRE-family HTH domain